MALIDKLTNLSSFDYNKVGEDSYNQSKNKNPHPIADVETQYDKFNPDDGQLIQKDIGERYTFSSGDNVSIDGGLIRGGAAVSAATQHSFLRQCMSVLAARAYDGAYKEEQQASKAAAHEGERPSRRECMRARGDPSLQPRCSAVRS